MTALFAQGPSTPEPLIYGVVMAALWAAYVSARRRRHRRSTDALLESESTGSTEPASLHPLIDPVRCLTTVTTQKSWRRYDERQYGPHPRAYAPSPALHSRL